MGETWNTHASSHLKVTTAIFTFLTLLSLCVSDSPYVRTQELRNWFSLNIFGKFTTVCRHTPILVEIWQEWRRLYIKICCTCVSACSKDLVGKPNGKFTASCSIPWGFLRHNVITHSDRQHKPFPRQGHWHQRTVLSLTTLSTAKDQILTNSANLICYEYLTPIPVASRSKA
jgi:hypothetical protein